MDIKKIAILSVALLLFSSNTYAQSANVEKIDNKIIVTTSADPNSIVMLSAVKSEYTLSDTEWICAIKETEANNNGIATFEFYMPEVINEVISDGEYKIYTKQTGKEMVETRFWYASSDTRTELENDFDTKTFAEIIADEDNVVALKAAGFEMDIYNNIPGPTAQSEVISRVTTEITDIASADIKTTAESFNNNLVVVAANTNVDASVLKDAIISISAVSSQTDAELMEWIIKCVDENSPYSDFSAVEKQIEVAEILSEIIDARFSQLTGLFDTYKTELGLVGNDTYAKYLASSSKEDINEDIAIALDSTKPVNADGLISIIKSCLPSSGGNGGNGGSGGGNGGGSGGSGGSYVGGSNSSGGSPVIGTTTAPIITPSTSNKNAFVDMSDAKWAEIAVNAMYEKGIVSGDGDGNFRPNDSVTREEFVKMIIVAAGLHNGTANCEFSDLQTSSWAYSYIASAVNNGVVNGVSETEFGLGQTLTRQDMAVICARTLSKVKAISAIREDVVFSDEADISDYAKESIHSLYSAEMINGMGDGSFAPKAIATRAQAAQMIYNLFVK